MPLTLVAALLLGLRHGFDHDHIAAICDISGTQRDTRSAMRLSVFYVLGHAAMVAALCALASLMRMSLPPRFDDWAQILVGFSLFLFGLYLLITAFWSRDAMPKSRLMLLTEISRKCLRAVAPASRGLESGRAARSNRYGPLSASLLGVVHGIGAETPSQLTLFLLAASIGSGLQRALVVSVFLAGLLLMNLLLCGSAAGFFGATTSRPRVRRLLNFGAAIYSLLIGGVFLLPVFRAVPAIGAWTSHLR